MKRHYPDNCPWCGSPLNIYWLHGHEFVNCDHCTYPFGVDDYEDDEDGPDEGDYEWDAGLYEEPDYDQQNEDRNPNDTHNL